MYKSLVNHFCFRELSHRLWLKLPLYISLFLEVRFHSNIFVTVEQIGIHHVLFVSCIEPLAYMYSRIGSLVYLGPFCTSHPRKRRVVTADLRTPRKLAITYSLALKCAMQYFLFSHISLKYFHDIYLQYHLTLELKCTFSSCILAPLLSKAIFMWFFNFCCSGLCMLCVCFEKR